MNDTLKTEGDIEQKILSWIRSAHVLAQLSREHVALLFTAAVLLCVILLQTCGRALSP